MARTPWREALDAKVRLVKYFKTNAFERSHDLVGIGDSYSMRTLGVYYRSMIHDAEPIWIAPNIGRGIVQNMCDENTVFDMASLSIPRRGLIWYAEPLTRVIRMLDGTEHRTILRGVLYGMERDEDGIYGMFACAWQQTATGLHPVTINAIANGQTIEEWIIERAINIENCDKPSKKVMDNLRAVGLAAERELANIDALEGVRSMYGFHMRYLYTLFSFMDQRIVTSPPTPVERSAQRLAQSTTPPVHPEVRVITWRLKKYEKMETTTRQVDWSCRWPSRAHDRHLADGRVIPIPASIKGPPDKPLKAATPNVHQVTRK